MLIVDDQPKCWSLLNFRSLENCGDGHSFLQQVDVTQLDQLHAVGLGLLNGLCEACLLGVAIDAQELGQANFGYEPPRLPDADGQDENECINMSCRA